MKTLGVDPEVITEADVRAVLGSRLAPEKLDLWIPRLLKLLKINEVNAVHRLHCQVQGPAFARRILQDPLINVRYRLQGQEHLEHLPSGAFITISNHPFGGLDGIILLDLMGHIREDYQLMVNNFLCRIGAMRDNFIPVLPPKRHSKEEYKPDNNLTGLIRVKEKLSQGHPVGFFPAGGIAVWSWKKLRVVEQPWSLRSIKLLSKAKLPVLPIHFKGHNSWLYNLLGMISLKCQVARIPAEIFNKRGKTISVSVRPLIWPGDWENIKDPKALASFFHDKTML